MSKIEWQEQDDIPVGLIIRRSARARRFSLRVSGIDGRVSLTIPRGADETEALRFVQQKARWITQHRAACPDVSLVEIGARIPFLGQTYTITRGIGSRVVLKNDEIHVPKGAVGARISGFLKMQARTALAGASDEYAARLGRRYSALILREVRSRWGSCSARGRLMYSWRLVMMPLDVVQYVAAHEVAHLAHMDHSEKFWHTVERIHGPYAAQRRWLREHGAQVHRYDFSA